MTQVAINILNYFFILTPGNLSSSYRFLISFIAILCFLFVIIVIIFRKVSHNKIANKLLKPFIAEFIILAIFFLLYLSFRANNIAIFSARILFYLLGLWLLFAIYRVINAITKKYNHLKNLEISRKNHGHKYFILKNKNRKRKKKR